jgi:hypothetical protein
MKHHFSFARTRNSPPTEQEHKEYLAREARRARKAQVAQDEAERCKANARRLIAAFKAANPG